MSEHDLPEKRRIKEKFAEDRREFSKHNHFQPKHIDILENETLKILDHIHDATIKLNENLNRHPEYQKEKSVIDHCIKNLTTTKKELVENIMSATSDEQIKKAIASARDNFKKTAHEIIEIRQFSARHSP